VFALILKGNSLAVRISVNWNSRFSIAGAQTYPVTKDSLIKPLTVAAGFGASEKDRIIIMVMRGAAGD
jgi:hypothetical protein